MNNLQAITSCGIGDSAILGIPARSTTTLFRNLFYPAVRPRGNKLSMLLTSAYFLALTLPATALSRGEIVYFFPLPDSKYLSPSTTVIVRTKGKFDPAVLSDRSFIQLTGSESGEHPWHSSLSDDGTTVMIIPDAPFTPGERVSVQAIHPLQTLEGTTIAPPSYRFDIGATVAAVQEFRAQPPFAAPNPSRSFFTRHAGNFRSASPLVSSDSLPSDFPLPVVSHAADASTDKIFLGTFKSGRAGDHQQFVTLIPSDEQYLMIVNNQGIPVFWKKTNSENMGFTLQPNGLLTYFDASSGSYLEMDSSYNVIDSYKCGNGYQTDLHELRLLADGHALLLGDDPEIVDMSKIVAGGNSNATVWGMVIQELDKNKNVIFQWRSFDHFLITDATHEDLTAASIDYVHANAIDLDADGNILLSSRHLDEITKINRTTGEIIWRWGGKNNQFQFINDSLLFSHQHSIRRTATGTMILFDNGNFRPVEFSRGVEYALDEQAKTATLVWQFRHSPDIFSMAMGSIERLADGNTLIGWGTAPLAFTEVHPDGSTALEAQFPDSIVSYRAFGFDWTQSTGATSVRKADAAPSSFSLEQNYPNPFNPSTTIRYSVARASRVRLVVYNVLGKKLATLVNDTKPAGSYTVRFDGSRCAGGVLMYRLFTPDGSFTKMMTLVK